MKIVRKAADIENSAGDAYGNSALPGGLCSTASHTDAETIVSPTEATSPSTINEKYSGGPNASATLESGVANIAISNVAIDPATNEPTAEVVSAAHCSLPVLAICAITNMAEGLGDVQLSHEQTLKCAKLAEVDFIRLINAFIQHHFQ